jgi:hypothetical protein
MSAAKVVMKRCWCCCIVLALVACEENPPAAYPPESPPVSASEASSAQEVRVDVDGDSYADTDPSALTDFRSTLDPHGTWAEDETYGTVWIPNRNEVGDDFAPYVAAGNWVYDDDYVWVSDYEWGWVPFHYGRWVWIDVMGWAWIPGRVYAPAWVVWRTGDDDYDYVGWSPMPPLWIWRGGVAVGIGFVPPARYVFCQRRDIFLPGVRERIVVDGRTTEIARHTRPYVPAQPTVVPRQQPYVRAQPVVTPRPFATPVPHGPLPSALHVEPPRPARPVPSEPSVQRARQFSRPSTAQPLGARPAVPHVVKPAPRPVIPRVAPPRPATGRAPHR